MYKFSDKNTNDNIDVKFSLDLDKKLFLSKGLEKYNFSKNKYLDPQRYENDKKYFGFYIYKENISIGGAYGWIDYENWVYLDLLYLEEKCRYLKLGTVLINKVEEFAKYNKCIGIITETWDFQAKGFYEKMGFIVYGQLENHPIGAIDYRLKKLI